MLTSTSSNIAELYEKALRHVMEYGEMTEPRGFKCAELSPYTMILTDPTKNILNDEVRKINKAFAAAEFMWIVKGLDDVESISKFNSRIAQFSDDGKTFYGAYGPRFVDQLPYIIRQLKKDPWTRQAVMTFWKQNPKKTKDVPCTVMLHFMRRPLEKLNLTVYMRSNDVWLGLPYDVHNFTCIQILVAQYLDLGIGQYVHIDGSLHAYDVDFVKIKECATKLEPKMYQTTDVNRVMGQKSKVMYDYLVKKGA